METIPKSESILEDISQALNRYHQELRDRKHGDIAASHLVGFLENTFQRFYKQFPESGPDPCSLLFHMKESNSTLCLNCGHTQASHGGLK